MKLKLSIAVGLAALIGLFVFAAFFRSEGPDRHYLDASKWVGDYEYGRLEEGLNYGHPVYTRALEELKLVDPESISAEPAKQLAADLEVKMQKFHERQWAEQQRLAKRKTRNKERNVAFFQAQARDRVIAVNEYPECEREHGAADDHDGS